MELDWHFLLPESESDDRPLELDIRPSSNKSKCDIDLRGKSDAELKDMISKHKSYLNLKTKDNGHKVRLTIQRYQDELNRRINNTQHKGGLKREATIQLSDQSDDGEEFGNDKKEQKDIASATFASIFSKKIEKDERRGGKAFDKDLSFISPKQGRKTSQTGRWSNWGNSRQQSSSRTKQFKCPTTTVDNKKHKISDSDKTVAHCASSLRNFLIKRKPALDREQPIKKFYSKPVPALDREQAIKKFYSKPVPALDREQPIKKFYSKPPSTYHLVDEDIEDPDVSNTTPYAEKLSDCMKDVIVYYPSRDDQDPIEVSYTDMECLAPEAFLSSTIMNFYIRYLQQSSSENSSCNYHFFNTYFYNKLKKLSYGEDSFLKFRKWWKGVNIFEKAYILLPVHESAHWSLGIICIPTKGDELGPIVLHLDSLGLHNSSSIFEKIQRFVKEEWSYLRNSEASIDLPITDEIWENLDDRIIDKTLQVPQQKNGYDCGLFVLYYMERFVKEVPERLTERDLTMFGKQWFLPEEASNLRVRINNLLVQEFNIAKDKETNLSPKC